MAGAQVTIWHNPRCGNSRGALQLLREHGIEPQVVDYLAQPPDRATLLQVAADSGECLGFALRDRRHAANPSAAALRLEAVSDAQGGSTWQVRKCRGGPAPAQTFALVAH